MPELSGLETSGSSSLRLQTRVKLSQIECSTNEEFKSSFYCPAQGGLCKLWTFVEKTPICLLASVSVGRGAECDLLLVFCLRRSICALRSWLRDGSPDPGHGATLGLSPTPRGMWLNFLNLLHWSHLLLSPQNYLLKRCGGH